MIRYIKKNLYRAMPHILRQAQEDSLRAQKKNVILSDGPGHSEKNRDDV
ncbi:hypothetical protein Mucpa_6082 [Mucilaginibacter paludis DSM 18603]|uniref:Uncharacterized protein n=1 Tax=Mucilaginibacter paludis DSM 18603 TaxID=714943 RepID=H1YCE9_9SPHI|nr:hypothetical protein Mucpa_6082 [Mucilaginibacter paludis DSM 18603]